MSAYVIKLTEEQGEEEKERITWCSKRKSVYFILASVLIFLAIFRLWLVTHMVAVPNNVKLD